jgi:VCBS repeat-containing protein
VDITAIADDTGTAGDFTTSDTTLIVSGSNDALAVDEKIQISSDGGLTWSDVSQGTNTSWSFDDTGNPHPSNFTYDVRIIDAAANVGNTDSQAVTINDPAAAYDDAVATTENTIVTADVFEDNGFGADSNPDGFSVTSMSGGMVGTQLTLLSGALLTLNADGTLSYDPNHRFDYLPTLGSGASNLTVTDTFTYTTTGGNTATVTVTVSGVDTDDVLYDSAGIDTLAGGIGNDVYYVNNTDDVVIEAANAGNDIVGATVNYTLSENHNIEVLSMLGSGLTGTGSSGTDTLHSAGGPNTLIGLGGDDHYYVNNSADVVIEEANGGIDIVGATVNYTLPENHNIETLSMLGPGLIGTGSSGADTLHSGWGANTLVGLGGDDLYFVNNSADVVIEAANGGNDFVGATVDYTLSENHNIETLSMLGSGLTGTGSAGADTLHSNGGPNTLVGLGGDDVYYVNNTDDVVIEAANGGSDNVVATVDYTLPTNVEALYMIGSGLTGAGNSNDNWLVTLGANTLIGGAGNDVFQFSAGSANGATVADFTHDQVTEWDFLVFSGFGTGAQGATFSQIGNTDQWQIHSGLDGHNETITLGVGPLHAGDFVFV